MAGPGTGTDIGFNQPIKKYQLESPLGVTSDDIISVSVGKISPVQSTSVIGNPTGVSGTAAVNITATATNQFLVTRLGNITWGGIIASDVPVQMSIDSDATGLKLVNDNILPGNAKYYGTSASGIRGYYDLPTSIVEGEWNFSTSIIMADPGSGRFRTNAIPFLASDRIAISDISAAGIDRTPILQTIQIDDLIYIQDKADSANWVRYRVTNFPQDNTTWWMIPVAAVEAGGAAPTNNTPAVFHFTGAAGAGSTGIIQLTGDVTAGPGTGTQVATLVKKKLFAVAGEDAIAGEDRFFNINHKDFTIGANVTASGGTTRGIMLQDGYGAFLWQDGFGVNTYMETYDGSSSFFSEEDGITSNQVVVGYDWMNITARRLVGNQKYINVDFSTVDVNANSHLNFQFSSNTWFDMIQMKDTGIFIQATSTPGTFASLKGLQIALNGDLTFDNYPNTRADAATTKALYVDATGNLKYGAIAATAGQRFGVAGEDAVATQNRSFNLNGGNRYWEVKDGSVNYFGLYDQSSGNNLAFEYFLESSTLGNQAGQAASVTSGWYTNHYNDANNGYTMMQIVSGGAAEAKVMASANNNGPNNVNQQLYLWGTGADATSYAQVSREWTTGVGNFGRMRLDIDGAKLQSKTTLAGTYKGVIALPSGDLRFENYPDTRADAATTKALYVDATGNLKYGTITASGGATMRFGKAGEDVTAGEDRLFSIGASYEFRVTGNNTTGAVKGLIVQEWYQAFSIQDGASKTYVENYNGLAALTSMTTGVNATVEVHFDYVHIKAETTSARRGGIFLNPSNTDGTAELLMYFDNGSGGSNTWGSKLHMIPSGVRLAASATPNTLVSFKGVAVLLTGQTRLEAYTTSTSFTGTATSLLAVDATGNIIQTSLTGGSSMRFGYTGEDVTATADRTFNLTPAYVLKIGSDFAVNSFKGASITHYYQNFAIEDTGVNSYVENSYGASDLYAEEDGVTNNQVTVGYDYMFLQSNRLVGNTKIASIDFGTVDVDANSYLNMKFTSTTWHTILSFKPTGIILHATASPATPSTYKGIDIALSGDLKFGAYPNTRNDGTTSSALYVDATGNLKYGPVAGAGGTPGIDDVLAVGQTLTASRTISTSAFTLTVSGGSSGSPTMSVSKSSGAGQSILGWNSGTGLGIEGRATGGGVGLSSRIENATTSTLSPIMDLVMFTSGVAAANIGGYIRYTLPVAANTSSEFGRLVVKVTDVTTSSEDSDFEVWTRRATTMTKQASFISTGQIQLSAYTTATSFTGTPISQLGVDASGNVVQTSLYGLTIKGPANTYSGRDTLKFTVPGEGMFVSDGEAPAGTVNISYGLINTGRLVNKVAAYNVTTIDHYITADATSAAYSVTLPTAINAAFGYKRYWIKKTDATANVVTIATTSSQTIDGAASYTLSAQGSWVEVISDGANWVVVNKSASAATPGIDTVLSVGQALTTNRTISAAANSLIITGNNSSINGVLQVGNQGTSGYGLIAYALGGYAIGGEVVRGTAEANICAVMNLYRGTGTTPGNNIGGAINLSLPSTTNSNQLANQITWEYVDVTHATRTSRFAIGGINAGVFANKLVIEGDGRIYGTGLHNAAGAVTGTTNQYVASGTYTPTFPIMDNITSVIGYTSQWIRVGNVVTVSGMFNFTPNATGGDLGISLPIPSNLTQQYHLAGTCANNKGECWPIRGIPASDCADVYFGGGLTVVNEIMWYTFTYTVL